VSRVASPDFSRTTSLLPHISFAFRRTIGLSKIQMLRCFLIWAFLLPAIIAAADPSPAAPKPAGPETIEGSPEWVEAAMERHDFQAVVALGTKYALGEGVPQDGRRAVGLFARVALFGDTQAERRMAIAYYQGLGVKQNLTKTRDWFEVSARDGNLNAQMQLGEFYWHGLDGDTNLEKAFSWINLAASQGFVHAQCELGIMYNRGDGVKRDYIESLKWFLLAAAAGDHDGVTNRDLIAPALDATQREESARRAKEFKPDTNAPMLPDDIAAAVCPLDRHFMIPMTVLGETGNLVVDTGSSTTCLDDSYRERLGEPLTRQTGVGGVTAAVNFECFDCPDFFIGQARIASLVTIIGDLKAVRESTGWQLDGMLGMNCLRYHVVCFDPDKGEFTVGGVVPEAVKKSVLAIPLEEYRRNIFAIKAMVNGSGPMPLFIDSGFDGSISLSDADWQKAFSGSTKKTVSHSEIDLTGTTRTVNCARLKSVAVGTNTYADWIAESQPGFQAGSHLGQKFLRRHVCYFDFPNGKLYLLPGRNLLREDELDLSGLDLKIANGKWEIESVVVGSPAFWAGLKASDQVVAINERDATSLNSDRMDEILQSKPGTEINLQILRSGEIKKIKFILQRQL
jgi:TPR repeat protein